FMGGSIAVVSTPVASDTTATPGVTYFYEVRGDNSNNGNVEGPPSNEISFTPPPYTGPPPAGMVSR
ncbi:MAG: hypothetical protein M3Y56_16630, partial [Armatimonadota bacterium]|nr:hypothetical protein [Armatimonadota bacterium]